MQRPLESVVHGSKATAKDLPSVDRLLRENRAAVLIDEHGHTLVVDEVRRLLQSRRDAALAGALSEAQCAMSTLVEDLGAAVESRLEPRMRAVLNLSGTVIHTNLGRALLADDAIAHVVAMMSTPNNLEFDLDSGGRGDRDAIVEDLICTLTGAQAATVVNNNAAAVLLGIAALAQGREVIVSRGELVEIGGAFRMPDVMASAGARMVEVGTTNRTHPHDYERAIGGRTALLMKVHTSNYRIEGFTSSVDEATLADIAKSHGLQVFSDLGGGALVDLSRWGLPREPMPRDMIDAGCDVVSFSGDKLLGGPQAGILVGTRDAIGKIRRFPMKRALRMSKLPLAALEATLRLYLRPERLVRDLPTLRLLARPLADIEATARAVMPALEARLSPRYQVRLQAMQSRIGSGALPVELLPSAGLAIEPTARGGRGRALDELASALRALPRPVVGRIAQDCLLLDMRCLETPALLVEQLGGIELAGGGIDLAGADAVDPRGASR